MLIQYICPVDFHLCNTSIKYIIQKGSEPKEKLNVRVKLWNENRIS